jgi:glycoside/pentoside/hexuronide:cation symporter, GPH family
MGAAPERVVGITERIGYALGDSASNLYWKTFEFFLLFYYTDVFGISAGAVGTMLLVTRVLDAVADPVMGAIADRTKTRWGHFRPYILWFMLPLAVAGVLTFTTPNLGSGAKIVYAYVTYGLLMFLYTAVNIPYTALLGVLTPNSIERTALSSLRFVGAFAAATFVQYFTLGFVRYFGQGNDQRGWQLTMVLYGALAIVMFLVCFSTTRERVTPPASQSADLRGDIKSLLGSKPWRVLIGALMLMLSAFIMRGGVTAYYFKYFVDPGPFVAWLKEAFGAHPALLARLLQVAGTKETLLGWFLVSNGIFGILGVMVTPTLVRWLGKKRVFVLAVALGGITYALLWLPGSTHIGWMFLNQIAASFILAPNSPVLFAMFADTADHGEWRTGRRTTGLVFASSLFGLKVGLGLGGWLLGKVLAAFGYVANVAQSATSIMGILVAISVLPGALLLLASLLMKFYELGDDTMVKIEQDLKERRGGEPAAASA